MKKQLLMTIALCFLVLLSLFVFASCGEETGNPTEAPTSMPTDAPTDEPGDPCANGHTEEIDFAVDPTCEETGLTEGKHCSVCNTVLVAQIEIDALGHTEVIDAAVAPTCTKTGLTEGKHCSVCNTVLIAQSTVAATGHDIYSTDSCYECKKCDFTAAFSTGLTYSVNNDFVTCAITGIGMCTDAKL